MAQQPSFDWTWNGTEWVPRSAPAPPPMGVAWARPYESPHDRSKFVTIGLLATAGALFVSIVVDGMVIAMVAQDTVSDTESSVAQALATGSSILSFATIVPAVVFFGRWLHRIVRNMPALGSPDARWSPSGAVWRCFLPIFSLYHPLLATRDAWRASDPAQRFLDVGARGALHVPMLFAAWWTLWLGGPLAVNIGDRMTDSEDMQTFTAGVWIDALGNVLLIAAAGLAILVVREITQRQDRKNELIATGQLA